MISLDRDSKLIGTVAIACAVVAATYIASHSWERVRNKPPQRTLKVTGSAKKRIQADLIEWNATVTGTAPDREAAYQSLHDQVTKARTYLEGKGLKPEQVEVSAVSVNELIDTEYVGVGEERVARQVHKGFSMSQSISLRSNDIPRVEKISREVTDLISQGVAITSYPPAYLYTKLGELKIEMLAQASKDARVRADNIVESAGGAHIGKLRGADMGVININPANSTETSWEGNNDTTSYEKDIITIVHITYELE
ncbi:MAG TPA: SIMPL domain-containing protein [Kofleriaceae bacterium]|nr:SIMPL domain-containing protein [Kofleriaceae bacterium]